MLIDSDTTAVLIRDLKHAIIGAKGSRACRESCNGKDKNKTPGRRRCWVDGKLAGWQEAGAGLAEEQAASSEHLSTVLARRAHAHTSAPASLSPPKPGESPRGSYAIVGKGSNYGGNATGVTHVSTGSRGVRSEITHVRISPIPAPPAVALHGIPPASKSCSPLPTSHTHTVPFVTVP